jgi:hypothetical protein
MRRDRLTEALGALDVKLSPDDLLRSRAQCRQMPLRASAIRRLRSRISTVRSASGLDVRCRSSQLRLLDSSPDPSLKAR